MTCWMIWYAFEDEITVIWTPVLYSIGYSFSLLISIVAEYLNLISPETVSFIHSECKITQLIQFYHNLAQIIIAMGVYV